MQADEDGDDFVVSGQPATSSDAPSSLIVTELTKDVFSDSDVKEIKLKTDSDEHLKIPELQKQFLISPPASPPVGWAQSREHQPGFDQLELLARLAGLNSEESVSEVVPMNENYPAIKVFPCKEDGDTVIKPKITATPRPNP